jgi:hypothetical protein
MIDGERAERWLCYDCAMAILDGCEDHDMTTEKADERVLPEA